jgi:hypothetical protein
MNDFIDVNRATITYPDTMSRIMLEESESGATIYSVVSHRSPKPGTTSTAERRITHSGPCSMGPDEKASWLTSTGYPETRWYCNISRITWPMASVRSARPVTGPEWRQHWLRSASLTYLNLLQTKRDQRARVTPPPAP